MTQADLRSLLTPPCGECSRLGAAIASGVRYCHGAMMWRWASERVESCRYRLPEQRASTRAAQTPKQDPG